MIRFASNPALVALAALAILGFIATAWALGVMVDDVGNISWSGLPSEEQLWQLRLSRIVNLLPAPAAMMTVASLLGILVVGSAERQSASRTRSAARPTGELRPEEQA